MPVHQSRVPSLRGRAALVLAAAAVMPAAFLAPAASAQVTALTSGPAGHFRTGTSRVLMINGDQLIVRHRPAGEISSIDPAPHGGAVLTLHLAGTTYDVPADAMPYLGHGLDPNLFNRKLLERLETGGKLAVTISYRGQRPSLPGIHVRHWGGTTATGVLTASSAGAFGAALFRQYLFQHATGNYRGGGLFGDGVNVALAGAPATGTARPQFPMHTLTVTGTNIKGKADNGDGVIVINVDNPARFGDPGETLSDFFHGTSKFSVPSGHYWAIADFTTPVGNGDIAQRLVVNRQFTVSGNTRLHLAARSATSKITFKTPRPAVLSGDSVTVTRTGAHGGPIGIIALGHGSPIWVSPTRTKPTIGTIQSYTFGQLVSPPKAKGTPYAYSLDFAGAIGMIPPQHFTAAPASLATVHERYYLDKKATGTWSTGGGFVAQLEAGILFPSNNFTMPGQQTQYLTGGPDIMWTSAVFPNSRLGELDDLHTVTAGQQITDTWNAYPLHPQPRVQLLAGKNARKFNVVPSAWRSGDEMFLLVSPFGDNQLGHTGEAVFSAKSSVTENGKKLRLLGFPGFQSVKLNPAPGTVVYSQTTTLQGPKAALSSRTTSTWTFRTSRSPATSAPPAWRCPNDRAANSKCSIPSMISLNYTVANLALNGVAPAGAQAVDLAVGHFQPSARPANITKVTAQVSYDGGKTWQPASTTPEGAGHYQLTFSPPPGVNVTTRITATDSTGASVAETILNAYRVGSKA
ncbi:MAG TPA: hypothetical protein VFI65_05445 [Streptosporangiaceae bacterium]|nr:hypothetical protein [Streptosporangiaceae bacterium]